MSTCPACGGVIGRDCFNPTECMAITRDMALRHQAEAQERERGTESRHFWVSALYPSEDRTQTVHYDGVIEAREPISAAFMRHVKDQVAIDAHLPNGSFVIIVSLIQMEEKTSPGG